ncbi:probable serine/threonine-protein kinase pats1 [Anneissia japonica]|uniref:probable serine/threonine-protein kinase pats1 n=1 Tax=Anneissia japonica TaxID=1529436 RepID=UPI001425A42B|nr:probable serine/threonine-protein kinase pats1 [Anneissia japonica]
MRGENPQHSNEDITFIWDFAGQQLYYITHRIFLTSEAVYLILFSLKEGMHNKGKRRFSKMAKYVMTYDMTNIQIIKYWMRLIYTYAIPVKAQQQLQAKKPQIAVVGTHSDCLEGTKEDKKKQIEEQYGILFQEIRGTPYESHVVRKMYAISNKYASQCKMLKTLKQDVGGFLKEMPKTIPLKWLKFQQILQENGRTSLHMTYAKVCKVATECGISVENLIHTLNYLHDLGIILYFENNRLLKHAVITNPRKLIFILKKIITEVEPDVKAFKSGYLWDSP